MRNTLLHRIDQQATGLALISCVLASPMVQATPSVNGNTISWPDDGWYQVQTSDGASALCNGGSSCTVEPGDYLVINHTLGIRYPDVQVGEHTTADEIVVSGQTISWPDLGWYQVQSADGTETYCNGGRSCTVEPGIYLVINHTTGVRYTDVEVLEGTTTIINRDNHVALLDQVFQVYTGNILGNTDPILPTAFMESHVSTSLEVPEEILNDNDFATLTQYACDNGGTLDYSTRSGFPYSVEAFEWKDCLDGETVRNGSLVSQDNGGYYGYYRYLLSSSAYSADYSSGERVEVSGSYGSISESNIDPSIRRIARWTTDGFNYLLQDDSTTLAISNANTDVQHVWRSRLDSQFGAYITGSFTLNSELTEQHEVNVEMIDTMSASASGNFSSSYPDEWYFTAGTLELTASDGSALSLEVDNGDESTLDIVLLQDGAELERFQQPWSVWQDLLSNVKVDPRLSY